MMSLRLLELCPSMVFSKYSIEEIPKIIQIHSLQKIKLLVNTPSEYVKWNW